MSSISNAIIFNQEKLAQLAKDNKAELASACDCVIRKEPGEYIHACTVLDVVRAVLCSELDTYDHNRGTGNISLKTVKDVEKNFSPHSINEFTIGRYNGKLRIADGHSRIEGLLRRYQAGKLTKFEKEFKVSVRIVPESKFLEVYEKRNSSPQHKNSEMITNPDYMYGSMLMKFGNMLGDYWTSLEKSTKLLQQLAYLIHYFSKVYKTGKEVSYQDIFSCRKDTRELRLTPIAKAPYSLNDGQYKKLCDGIKFYLDVMSLIRQNMEENINGDVKPLKSIIASSPLMGLIVAENVSGRHSFGKSSVCLASRIQKNRTALYLLTPCMTHSGGGSTIATENGIRQLLKPIHAE